MNPFPFAGPPFFLVLIAKRYRKSVLSTEARPKRSQARLFVSVGETFNASFVRTGAARGALRGQELDATVLYTRRLGGTSGDDMTVNDRQ